jgi:ribosomal-protein-alanine N-acetyltransferase
MNFKVLAADAACCRLLAALHGRCFSEAWSDDAFAGLMAMPGAFALLVSPEGGEISPPIGFALARIAGGECEIITIGVLAAHRGVGAGNCLLRATASRARELGAAELLLEVAENNVAAMALYRAAAFVPVGRRKDYYRDANGVATDAIVMRRSLIPPCADRDP